MSDRTLTPADLDNEPVYGRLPPRSQLSSSKLRLPFLSAGYQVSGSPAAVSLNLTSTETAGTTAREVTPELHLVRAMRRAKFIDPLIRLYIRTRKVGWDGYSALPLTSESMAYALEFLSLIPTNIADPEIAADSDGEVAVEWDFGPSQIFSVRVGNGGILNYAGLVGHTSIHGQVRFEDQIPNVISNGIDHVIRNVAF